MTYDVSHQESLASAMVRQQFERPHETLEVYLRSRPKSVITDETFGIRRTPLPSAMPTDHLLIRTQHVSCDPAMRGWLTTRRSYIEPVEVGAVMRAMGIGTVLYPAPGFRRGDLVHGPLGWTQYSVIHKDMVTRVSLPRAVPATAALGVLGTTGMTAYFGLIAVAKVKKGDVVVVSAAAGATGSVVAQIAKNVYGCYVVGITGGIRKCTYLKEELGIEAVDYKDEKGIEHGLKTALAGKEIDIYFDNVGGPILEAALRRIAIGARVVLCGAISVYNEPRLQPGPRNYLALISKRAIMQGFILYDFEKQFPTAGYYLSKWISAGKIKAREHEVVGLVNAPEALKSLFEGRNIGKVIVKVFEEDENELNKIAAKL